MILNILSRIEPAHLSSGHHSKSMLHQRSGMSKYLYVNIGRFGAASCFDNLINYTQPSVINYCLCLL